MAETLYIRIKRVRTETKDSTFEIFERWASIYGHTCAAGVEAILSSPTVAASWQAFLGETRNPGKATS